MLELGFGNQSDFDLKIVSLGLLLVWFLVEIWSDKSLILRFLGLIVCLAALLSPRGWVPLRATQNLEGAADARRLRRRAPPAGSRGLRL